MKVGLNLCDIAVKKPGAKGKARRKNTGKLKGRQKRPFQKGSLDSFGLEPFLKPNQTTATVLSIWLTVSDDKTSIERKLRTVFRYTRINSLNFPVSRKEK